MAAEITQISSQEFISQNYQSQDTSLLSSFNVNTFLSSSSYIEYFVYDNNQNILSSEYDFKDYTILNDGQLAGNNGYVSQIIVDPELSLINNGYDQGEYISYYNIFNKQIGSFLQQLYISEISSDRTEIRLDSTSLTDLDIVEQTNNFIQQRNDSTYFLDFYLNFGDNILSIANNIQLDNQDPTNPTILVKLYEALPEQFDLNSTLWIVTLIEESLAYQVKFEDVPFVVIDTTPVKGPNFNLDLKDQVNNSTQNVSYEDLTSTTLSSSLNQLNSLLEEKEIDINVDYTNFSDFIHFSSAQTRLENFYYKVGLIQEYSSSINLLNSTNSSSLDVGNSKEIYENKINDIITNFDGYDYYLYYSSGSWAYPKMNSEPPYQLYPVDDDIVLNWYGSTNEYSPLYGGIILSASLYDNQNKDILLHSIPEYLRDDSNNQPYELFIDMVAQHFDNIWIYYKDVTQKYNADNRLEYGISKDIVADAIRDFGIKLYQNNFSNDDLYTAFLGLTPNGALFPFPNITGSLPTPSGFEYVDTLISASNDYLPLDDVNKSLYKRIYHNLPYLLKSKGTLAGLRALITSYGIPDTILRINEYGGKDKVNSNDWDYWQNEFNYAFNTSDDSLYFSLDWNLNPDWNSPDNVPSTLAFRFKTDGFPGETSTTNQTLWYGKHALLTLTYTGSGYTSGSYDGSIIDPYYQYGTLTLYPNYDSNPNASASIYLPFFNNNWWSIMATRKGDDFILYAGNKIYEGGDNGTLLGFFQSSSITEDSTGWIGNDFSSFGDPYGLSFSGFYGSYQEARYYTTVLSESVFKDYIMNPASIEGNSINSGPNELAFRASLGGELYTGSNSIHPKSTGSWSPTSSFISGNEFSFNSTPTFVRNEEYFFYDQPVAGIKNSVSDKIRIESNTIPSGDTLSPYRSLAQNTAASSSYTPNINYLEVSFSPQNEIDEDIMDQIGFFNIGDYIGDPAERFSGTSYPNLDKLRNEYFEKYTKNYNLVDFIRLIKFFDNSLFKMIKDFVPARTSLASGIVIKQTLLERNKYPQPQVAWENLDISGTLKPTWNDYNPGTVEHFEGGTGGSFESFNLIENVSQSWDVTYNTPLGEVTVVHNSQDEFYDGEFSGSVILVTTQSLNQAYPLENALFGYTPILYKSTNFGNAIQSPFASNQLINSHTIPHNGEILISVRRKNPTNGGGISLVGVDIIKIAKNDFNGNDLSTSLGQITNLLIKYTNYTNYTNYKVNNITEYPTYYLYDIEVNSQYSNTDTEIKNYYVSASITSSASIPTSFSALPWGIVTGNIAHYGTPYFSTSSGLYTLENTPNITLNLTASITTSGSSGVFGYFYIPQGQPATYSLKSFNSGSNVQTTITSSFNFVQGDILFVAYDCTTSCILKSGSLLITQSVSPTESIQDSIILEPYITTPNYYNSDFNPLLNNIEDERLSTIYQDVDYSSGILIPTNFDLLIEGTAVKAPVQDSNYTTKRHILPRYEGSKSTSQNVNKWTSGDSGTYGKLPTVESLKTYVAYSDNMGGYPPERMDTSGILIKYLISEDGDLIAPNTSPDSLGINQQTFLTGENISLQSLSAGTFAQNPLMSIFRGGTSIEPIMYNQIGHYDNPPMSFTGSITFSDRNPSSSATVPDFTATLSTPDSPTYYVVGTSFTAINNTQIISSGSNITAGAGGELGTSSSYKITSAILAQNIDLVFEVDLNCISLGGGERTTYARISRNRGGNITPVSSNFGGIVPLSGLNINFTATVNKVNLQTGDIFFVEMIASSGGVYYKSDSLFKISTNPYPTPPLNVTNLFVTGSTPGYGNYIYTTSSQFIQYLNSSNIYQQDIAGSGFNPIVLPLTIKKGDEFRFEGDETKTFMVNEVYISPYVLAISLDHQISGSDININQFLLRRYIDNAGALIVDGFKPSGYDPPYLIKPEYMSEKMEKNIGKYIEDFTNKGLL